MQAVMSKVYLYQCPSCSAAVMLPDASYLMCVRCVQPMKHIQEQEYDDHARYRNWYDETPQRHKAKS